jgi:hypothetical protein
VSARRFGRFEVRNRLYFVRKHGLSVGRCYLGLAIRLAMSVCGGVIRRDLRLLSRALCNVEELIGSVGAGAFVRRPLPRNEPRVGSGLRSEP